MKNEKKWFESVRGGLLDSCGYLLSSCFEIVREAQNVDIYGSFGLFGDGLKTAKIILKNLTFYLKKVGISFATYIFIEKAQIIAFNRLVNYGS